MGIFNFFKNNLPALAERMAQFTQPEEFSYYYLYGFTDSPNSSSADKTACENLFRMVIGETGGIAIANSFHPYRIFDKIGVTIWADAFYTISGTEKSEAEFERIKNGQDVFVVSLPPENRQEDRWSEDGLNLESPFFTKYRPFIIPMLVPKNHGEIRWNTAIAAEMERKGHAAQYMETINEAIRFLLPDPGFVLGFDEFDKDYPHGVVQNFLRMLPSLKEQEKRS